MGEGYSDIRNLKWFWESLYRYSKFKIVLGKKVDQALLL